MPSESSKLANLDSVKDKGELRKMDRKLLIELSIVLCIKIALILTICFIFFGPETKPDNSPQAVSAAILSRPTQLPPQGEK